MNTEQKIKEAFEAWQKLHVSGLATHVERGAIKKGFRAGYLALLNSLEPSNLICNTHLLYRLPKGVKQ